MLQCKALQPRPTITGDPPPKPDQVALVALDGVAPGHPSLACADQDRARIDGYSHAGEDGQPAVYTRTGSSLIAVVAVAALAAGTYTRSQLTRTADTGWHTRPRGLLAPARPR